MDWCSEVHPPPGIHPLGLLVSFEGIGLPHTLYKSPSSEQVLELHSGDVTLNATALSSLK